MAAYTAALSKPFSPTAGGARVLDLYATPTVTRTIRRTFTVSSNASGECDLIFLAHPGIPLYSPRGSISSGTTWALSDNPGTTVATGMSQDICGLIDLEMAAYRVVGCGIKLLTICADSATSGTTVTGTIPYSGLIPAAKAIGAINDIAGPAVTVGNWLDDTGIPQSSSIVDVASMAGLAKAVTTSANTLEESSLIAVPRVVSPAAFNWRRTRDSHFGTAIADQTSGTYVQSGDASYLDASGWEAIVFAATNLPVSTKMFTVETIFHIEGPARINSSSLNADTNTPSPVNWNGFVHALQVAAQSPAIQTVMASAAGALKAALLGVIA